MKLSLGLVALVTLAQCLACSGSPEGEPSPGSTAGNAGLLGGAGGMNNGAGGAHGGAANGGAASGGAANGGAANGGAANGGAGQQAGTGGSMAGNTSGGGAANGGAAGASGASGAAGSGGAGPLDGAALFTANCQVCHGNQGVGGQLAPEIQHPIRDYGAWVVRNGRPGTGFPAPMLPFATSNLSDAELKLIWDYLDQPPQPTTGQNLYHDYCANCHGADGKGGPTGRGITNELAKLKAQVRSGAGLNQIGTRKNYMPAFSTSRVSDADLNLIYTYVDSL